MRKFGKSLIVVLCSGAFLLSCTPREKGSATPQAAEEFAFIGSALSEVPLDEILGMPEFDELSLLMADFASTADARIASRPSGVTVLHLACIFKKPELARCLLLDQADPNAATAMGDTPLSLALTQHGAEDESVTEDTIIQLLDVLVKGGADIKKPVGNNVPLLNYAGLNCASEKVFLHLLSLGCPKDETTIQAPALMGWNHALQSMLEQGEKPTPATLDALLLMAASNLHADTVQLLLAAGADVNAHQLMGTTPLVEVAGHLLSPAEEEETEHRNTILDICALLIKNGADPALSEIRQEGSPAFCAADILTRDQATIEALRARGIELKPQGITFTSGVALLEEIGKAHVLERIPAAEYFDAIAAIFYPTEEMRSNPMYHEVLPMAIELLHSIDPQRCSHLLGALPLWANKEAWDAGHGAAMIPAITQCEHLVLPKEIICAHATRLASEGRLDEAACMIELLSRCPDAKAEIEQFSRHSAGALKAGALAARLRQEGLPTPRDGDVELWLNNQRRNAEASPVVQKALLLTSLSRMWYGDMPPDEQKLMFDAMEEIGAPEAARHYRAIAAAMDDPEVLDKLTDDSDSWKFELEIATAEYILAHRMDFLSLPQENTD